MDNCEVKFGELTRTVATNNVTISALVVLFNTHNVQRCWLRGLSGTYVFTNENGSFQPQLESFGVYELGRHGSRHDGATNDNNTCMLFAGWEVRIMKTCSHIRSSIIKLNILHSVVYSHHTRRERSHAFVLILPNLRGVHIR